MHFEYKTVYTKQILDAQRKLQNCQNKTYANTLLVQLCDEKLLAEAVATFCPYITSISSHEISREDLEKILINAFGIDLVIKADKEHGAKHNKHYQNSLMALRSLRGKEIIELSDCLTNEEFEEYVSDLSEYAKEDYQNARLAQKNLATVNETVIKSL